MGAASLPLDAAGAAALSGRYRGPFTQLPTSLTPTEDRGVIYVFVKGAEGTSIERMKRNMQQVESAIMPMLGKGVVQALSFSTPPLAVAAIRPEW